MFWLTSDTSINAACLRCAGLYDKVQKVVTCDDAEESLNVPPSVFSCFLAVVFVIKSLINSQLHLMPLVFQFQTIAFRAALPRKVLKFNIKSSLIHGFLEFMIDFTRVMQVLGIMTYLFIMSKIKALKLQVVRTFDHYKFVSKRVTCH